MGWRVLDQGKGELTTRGHLVHFWFGLLPLHFRFYRPLLGAVQEVRKDNFSLEDAKAKFKSAPSQKREDQETHLSQIKISTLEAK